MTLLKFIEKTLPAGNIGSGIQYNESQNVFLTSGYTSNAGNTYFRGLRLSDRIFIVLDIGIGYAFTFLNGITIYSNSNNEKKLVASRSYYCRRYSEFTVKNDTKEIVLEELRKEAQNNELIIEESTLMEFVDLLVEETYKNQIETIKKIELNNLLSD